MFTHCALKRLEWGCSGSIDVVVVASETGRVDSRIEDEVTTFTGAGSSGIAI